MKKIKEFFRKKFGFLMKAPLMKDEEIEKMLERK